MIDENQILAKAFEFITQYQESNNNETSPVVDFQEPQVLQQKIDLSIKEDGISYDELFDYINMYLSYCVKTSHKQFFNQLYGGFNFPAFLGEIFTALTNTSIYTYEVAPVASLMEIELVQKMNGFVGFDHGDGIFLTGGSNANLIAMLCARNTTFPAVKKSGVENIGTLTAFVSDQAHYSFDKAANLLGLGTNNLVKITSDENGRMIPQALEDAIQKSQKQGEKPFFIAATAGTTMLGAFDPVPEIAAIAKKYHTWLHVDGAFGGSVILSKKHRYLLDGVDQADSFAWDAHKIMNIPLICSVILIKQKGILLNSLSTSNTDYLFHDHDDQAFDPGTKSIQCGRRVDALKLWLAWKFFGDRGYEHRINRLFDLANYATKKVTSFPTLELLAVPQSLTICFRYVPASHTDINEFNLELRERLRKSGKALVNYGYLKDKVAIRFICANPDVEKNDIDRFFDNLMDTASQIN